MASSKKSLSDKFALEAKKKSPGKQSKKEKKAAKSLSRELLKPSTTSPKRKAQKSHSDSLVVKDSSKVEDKEPDTTKLLLKEFQKQRDDVTEKVVTQDKSQAEQFDGSRMKEETTEQNKKIGFDSPEVVRSTFDVGSISFPSHTIEKLEPSLKDTWHKPPPTPGESPDVFVGIDSSTPKTVRSSTEIHLKPRDAESVSSAASLLSVSSFSSAVSNHESITSCPSIDSISSELDTIIGDDINISECSSTSTPIRFTLQDENSEKPSFIKPQRPPKFSLIREAKVEFEGWSSSRLSPTNKSTSGSLKSTEGRNRIDDFSDDSDCSKLRESSEFSDDMQELDHPGHFVPLNKQLQIVTSMDRLTDGGRRRRSHSPPKSSDQGLLHQVSSRLPFVDFMRRCGLSSYLYYLPADMSLERFRNLRRQDLRDVYNIVDPGVQEKLLKAIYRAKEEDTDDDVSGWLIFIAV